MTRVSGDWVNRPETAAVLAMLSDGGFRAYFVGGCVRDALIGRVPGDIDIATDATPDDVIALSRAAGLNPVATGKDHGTITVVSDGVPHEVTTFRRDVETDGRRAVVAFSDRMEEDAARRDFTMNALYSDATGAVHDPTDEGLTDLAARRVRFIGDAEKRIREDYLRILRFFRFHAWFGDPVAGMDADGLAAIAANTAGLETLSAERIGHEMRRLLAAPDPAPAVAAMRACGVLAAILPGADDTALAPLVHLEGAQDISPSAMRRLCALGGDGVADRLRLSRKEARHLDDTHRAIREGGAPGALGYLFGVEVARDALLVTAASLGQPPDPGALDAVNDGATREFPVRAADLTSDYEGAALGARLKALEARWIASGFTLDRAALLSGD